MTTTQNQIRQQIAHSLTIASRVSGDALKAAQDRAERLGHQLIDQTHGVGIDGAICFEDPALGHILTVRIGTRAIVSITA